MGNSLLRLIVALLLVGSFAAMVMVWKGASRRIDSAMDGPAAPATQSEALFTVVWSIPLQSALVHDMALSPGRRSEFLALNNDTILRFDRSGASMGSFAAPAKSSRIATDPTGAVPHVLIVSSKTKWTGAIDYVQTTDVFLHALEPTTGREIWRKRYDPKEISSPEPVAAALDSGPAVVLSGGRHIIGYDASGTELWDLPLWHHPGTVTAANLSGVGAGALLAAVAPKKQIVRIDSNGRVAPWADGDGPTRLRAMNTEGRTFVVSLRQVFGRGPGIRHTLTFFDQDGTPLREVELPPDSPMLSYAPIGAMGAGGGRRNWVVGLADGRILVYSPYGDELARHATGARIQAILVFPQPGGPDFLVTATRRGLTALRPAF